MSYWSSKPVIRLRQEVDNLITDSIKYIKTTNDIYFKYMKNRIIDPTNAKKIFENELNDS